MANENLIVDDSELLVWAAKIKDAVDDYKAIGEKPFDDDIEALNKMNTDFTAKLKEMIKNLNSGNKKMIKALDKIAENTEKIVKNLQEVDEHALDSMGNKGGE